MSQLFRTAGACALMAMTFAAGACGSDPKAPEVASAGGTPTAARTSGASDVVTAYVEGVRAYVACMRGEGVKVGDPDSKGKFEFEGDPKALKEDPTFIKAQKACGEKLPPVPDELRQLPPRTAEEIEAAREYAKCMRANGAPDFPDPLADGYFPAPMSSEDEIWDQNTAGAKRAIVKCAPIIGDKVDPGQGNG
ncbi:hypothetical protein [Luedemannella helvata]